MAYPVEDLVVLAVAVMVLVHARDRTGLLLVGAGIVGMGVADSAFVYLTATDDYAPATRSTSPGSPPSC